MTPEQHEAEAKKAKELARQTKEGWGYEDRDLIIIASLHDELAEIKRLMDGNAGQSR